MIAEQRRDGALQSAGNGTALVSPAATFAAAKIRELVATARSWQNGVYPPHTELDEVTQKLRLLLDVLLAEAEARAAEFLEDGPARRTLAVVVADARRVISDGPGPGLVSATRHARSLAEVANRLLEDRGVTGQ